MVPISESFKNSWGTTQSGAHKSTRMSARSIFNGRSSSVIRANNRAFGDPTMIAPKRLKPSAQDFLLPWFVTKDTVRKIESLLPYYYHVRFRLYFDRYGCVRCARKNVIYGCNGLCLPCVGIITNRLKQTDRQMRRRYAKQPGPPSKAFLRRLTSARELLADFRKDF